LAAVTRSADPGGAVHRKAHVAFVAEQRLTGVEPKPHANLRSLGPFTAFEGELRFERCR